MVVLPMIFYWVFNQVKYQVRGRSDELRRKITFATPKLAVTDLTQLSGKDNQQAEKVEGQDTAKMLHTSGAKLLQILSPRKNPTIHIDASDGV
jgi:hypothetical protein